MAEADEKVQRLQAAREAREAFDRREDWRHDRLTEIGDGLEHHGARAVLSAVREGDPLAYGEDRLRQARSTYAADLCRVERDQEREGRGCGREYGEDSWRNPRRPEAYERGELSAVVAELDDAIEACEPSPLQRSILARSAQERSRELDGLSRPSPHRDSGHDLGLGR
jgi:hypothetical protein